MIQLEFLLTLLGGRVERVRRNDDGVSAVEWVVITALLVGIALAVGTILLTKIRGKADSINLDE
ncbi:MULTISPECIES: Flp family type IVb pilin [unclassified Nocardioides]|uniref:Flp family type IVb pilin n=1 Tax=unclassified Nocardioides TaxID=2615069 RepID=UPI0006FAEDDF|nr:MULTISPECIES: hypothetical protein [unclassified Nocardioides]KQY64681.1 hypothetical protein ASD30_07195 [Nocardioides sp. Root140]KQZ67338.1 hypothetical protein ASD66_20510 [Nocardioides sp. Root151]KRF12584.1 hypothetical protein ASH02_13550 [Nocardioides sp. Soil796]